MIRIASSIFICMLCASVLTAQPMPLVISWKKIAEMPSQAGKRSMGFAGAINGVHNDVLIVAGGSNFPDAMPWEGGKKKYSDKIFVLEKSGNKYRWNKHLQPLLPEPVAYCGSTSTPSGVVYAGGENENGLSNKCFLLKWNARTGLVAIESLPDLPLRLTNIALTNVGNTVYAVGGDRENASWNSFYCLDVASNNREWKTLPALPVALANATAVPQNTNAGMAIFVIGGRSKTASGISELHSTTYAFDLEKQAWQECAPIFNGNEVTNLSAASCVPLGDYEILITGGDNGKTFHEIETLFLKIANASSKEEQEHLTKEKNELLIHHNGFDSGLLLYNTNTNAWTKVGELPFKTHVTTTDVKWGTNIVISNGEIQPGIRSPDIMIGKVGK